MQRDVLCIVHLSATAIAIKATQWSSMHWACCHIVYIGTVEERVQSSGMQCRLSKHSHTWSVSISRSLPGRHRPSDSHFQRLYHSSSVFSSDWLELCTPPSNGTEELSQRRWQLVFNIATAVVLLWYSSSMSSICSQPHATSRVTERTSSSCAPRLPCIARKRIPSCCSRLREAETARQLYASVCSIWSAAATLADVRCDARWWLDATPDSWCLTLSRCIGSFKDWLLMPNNCSLHLLGSINVLVWRGGVGLLDDTYKCVVCHRDLTDSTLPHQLNSTQ